MKWKTKNTKNIDIKIIKPRDTAWKNCEELEYRVFLAEGYIDKNEEKRLIDYDNYNPKEIIAAYVQNELAGVWRLIYAPKDETKMRHGLFPTIDSPNQLPLYSNKLEKVMNMNPQECFDMAACAIPKQYRDGRVSTALFKRVMTRGWEKPPVRYGLGAPDTNWLNRTIKRDLPLEALGKSSMYWGSDTTPVMADTKEILKSVKGAIALYSFYRAKGYMNKLLK